MLANCPSRMTVVFFAVSGLSLLKLLDLDEETRVQIIEWIYRQQLDKKDDSRGNYGFRGSPANGCNQYDFGHLAMTYAALATLKVLDDDLTRVNKKLIKNGLKELQLDSGWLVCDQIYYWWCWNLWLFSFSAVYGSESDMRFLYCAACICHLLDDWTMMDMDQSVEFISQSLVGGEP